jgi:hypothetical protein
MMNARRHGGTKAACPRALIKLLSKAAVAAARRELKQFVCHPTEEGDIHFSNCSYAVEIFMAAIGAAARLC